MKSNIEMYREDFKAIDSMLIDAYSYKKSENNRETFLNKARKLLEFILQDYFEYAFESLPELRYDRSNKKNSLEGDIAFLYKHGLISSEINSYMHIVRQAGNMGSHINEKPKAGYADICDAALRGIVTWYVCEHLEMEFYVDSEILKAGPVIIPRKPDKDGLMEKRNKKKVKYMAYSFWDIIKQIAIIIAATALVYFIINKLKLW